MEDPDQGTRRPGAAIELKKSGIEDLVIFEKGDDVGGVWRENTYPGAACDIPSPYYSYSFEPNPNWPERFSRQPAILEYMRGVADKYDVRRHVRFRTEVTAAEYDEARGKWRVHTSRGDIVEVDALVPAVGQLSRPSWPNIPGRKKFKGVEFHSAECNHAVDLAGKRVAVVGTGASAIQFVPEIQPVVHELKIFQRTPAYLVPRPDVTFGSRHHTLFATLPITQLAERGTWWTVGEALAISFLYSKPMARAVTALSRRHMRKQLEDPELFAKMWPTYPVGCKRVLFSSNYLPAVAQPNVEVLVDGIQEIDAKGIVDSKGVLHEVDVIVWGTGFTASDFLAPMKVTGAGGRDLREQWGEGARAYLGISVPDFPNLYLMYGPNTNVGSGSIIFMLEQQAKYLTRAIRHGARLGRPIAVRRKSKRPSTRKYRGASPAASGPSAAAGTATRMDGSAPTGPAPASSTAGALRASARPTMRPSAGVSGNDNRVSGCGMVAAQAARRPSDHEHCISTFPDGRNGPCLSQPGRRRQCRRVPRAHS